jgi:putative ABC transport system permease protein
LRTLGAPILAGRDFTLTDTGENRNVAIVDQAFVRHVLPGLEPVGARVRQRARDGAPAGPWLEIVGVVRDLSDGTPTSDETSFLYRPTTAGADLPIHMAVHVTGDMTAVMSSLRKVAAAVDPTLRLDEIRTIDQLAAENRIGLDFFARLGTGIAMVALLLSTAGVYALMSFTVARRTPEIAIRLALGANTRRVVLSTFSRALLQVALGVLAGAIPGGVIVSVIQPEILNGAQLSATFATCAGVIAFMIAVTVAACAGPARRALRIQPADALKAT